MKNSILVRSVKIAFKTCFADCVFMMAMQLLITCIPIGGLYVLKRLVDSLTVKSVPFVIVLILEYSILIWMQKAIQDWYNHYFLTYFSLLKFEKKIKETFFKLCLRMKLDDYNDAGVVNHSLRAKNASVNILRLYQAMIEMAGAFLSVFAMGIVISGISRQLFIVFIAVSLTEILNNVFTLYQNKKFLYKNTQLEKEENEISELLLNAKSLKEIVLLNSVPFVSEKWTDAVERILANEKVKNGKIFAFSLCMKLFYCAGMLFSYFLLFRAFLTGEIGMGGFSVTVSAFVMLNNTFRSLFEEVSNVSQFALMVRPFFDYVDGVAERGGDKKRNEVSVAGNLRLENVSYRYHNAEKNALDKINLSIEEGKKYVIVGENGSGKTTLMKVILGLYEPTGGEIFAENINLKDWNEEALYQSYSDVPQEYNMYAVSVKDNIQFGNTENKMKLDDALCEMDLQELAEKKDCIIGKEFGGIELSGGQKQKIAILRAENKGGKIFCLDEPTSAIDPLQEKKIFDRVYHVEKGKTTIIVSHRLALCRLADCIIVMKQGRIAELGTHGELMKKKGIYEAMYHEQAQLYQVS